MQKLFISLYLLIITILTLSAFFIFKITFTTILLIIVFFINLLLFIDLYKKG